jgi:pimeloyl-ACP methyl ester carboxylesterase
VVTIDLAGHGKSGMSRKSYTMGAFAEDVVAVVGELHLDQVVLIGHSMGGAVVVEAARRIPDGVLGIVGVDTLQDPEFQPTQASVGEFLAPFRSDFQIAMRKLVEDSFFLPQSDPAIVQKVANDMAAEPPEVGISAVKEYNEWALRDLSVALEQLRAPICLINSDLFPTNVEAYSKFTSFELKLMPGIGHFVMMEDPETFNRLLSEAVEGFSQISQPTG